MIKLKGSSGLPLTKQALTGRAAKRKLARKAAKLKKKGEL